MKKINLKGISEILSEKELKNVLGGSGSGSNGGGGARPCPEPPYRACNGPHGVWMGGGLCCLVPCFGYFNNYGYAILQGLSRCP